MSQQTNKEITNIKAIHDKDLMILLERLNILEKINNHEIACESCSKTIECKDIGAIFIEDNKIKICCSLFECIDYATRKQK